jgi:hypothetical protein
MKCKDHFCECYLFNDKCISCNKFIIPKETYLYHITPFKHIPRNIEEWEHLQGISGDWAVKMD